jgi:HK97 family phage portal protein
MAWNWWPFGQQNKDSYLPTQDRNFWVNLLPSLASPSKVTAETAMSVSAVWACVRVLSESIATLPFSVYQENENRIDIAKAHPVHALLHDKPYKLYNAFNFRETMMIYACLHGNAIAAIKRNETTGRIEGLKILDVRHVSVYTDIEDNLIYVYMPDDMVGATSYMDSEVIHITTMSQNGIWGLTPIQSVSPTFQEALDTRKYQNGVTANGAKIGGFIKYPGKLTQEAFENLRKGWAEKYEGAGNAGKTAILEEGAEFVPISMNNKDLQIIEQRKMTIEEIARCYRVPLHLIGDLTRSTNNNIEHQSIEFVQHTLYPWVKRWETEVNDKLFTAQEKADGYYARLNLDGFQRGDSQSRSDFYATMHRIGVLSQNDIRKLEGYNPIPEGDTYFVQGAMVPTDQLINQSDNNNG